MHVFSLKVRRVTESLDNHCGVLEVLQVDVLILAEENFYCFSIALFFFQESYGLVRQYLIYLIILSCPYSLSTTEIIVITTRHSDFFKIIQFLLLL